MRLGDTKTGASIRPLPAPARAILTDEIGGYPVAIGRGRGDCPRGDARPKRRPVADSFDEPKAASRAEWDAAACAIGGSAKSRRAI